MSLLSFFLGQKKNTASVAKERLQIILAHERSGRGQSRADYLPQMREELMAVIAALQALKKEELHIEIYSDSQYVVKAVKEGWLRKWMATNFRGGKKNADLWRIFYGLSQRHHLHFHWVKGHADNEYNNRCDQLATEAAAGKKLKVDTGYEESLT